MPTSIVQSLGDAATRYAHRAVESFVGHELTDFYLSAGIALEQAMKTRLARENIAFIGPDRAFKSTAALWKAQHDVGQLPIGTRTVGGAEAFDRVKYLEPSFARHKTVVEDVLRFRNGEAHIGAPGSTDHRVAFVAFLTALSELLRVSMEAFWGEHAEFVQVLIDETAAELDKRVREKVARGRLVFKERYSKLGAEQREALLRLVEQETRQQLSDRVLERNCPVCSSPCLLSGDNNVEFELDWDHREDVATGGRVYVDFHAHSLKCRACDLELDGEDELKVARVETVLVNDVVDLDEYMREYYTEDR